MGAAFKEWTFLTQITVGSGLLVSAMAAAAQQTGQNVPPGANAGAPVSNQLVVETVVVKDKAGNPIEG
ncbi:MAG TPA: hypothetical protein VGV15_23965 [Terriglobales bacterium]|nr:hypothetical protein [Terriglobales bacterium]